MKLSKGKIVKAVHKGLKLWDEPTREGTEILTQLKVARKFGYKASLSIVDSRIAVSNMLFAYIIQLERLQPLIAQVLIRRYKFKDTTKNVAHSMHVSMDLVNRLQRMGISYISEFIYDDETRLARKQRGN